MLGKTWEYRSRVMTTLEWPRCSLTALAGIPLIRPKVAKAWRKPWKVSGGICRALVKAANSWVRRSGSTGEASAWVNT